MGILLTELFPDLCVELDLSASDLAFQFPHTELDVLVFPALFTRVPYVRIVMRYTVVVAVESSVTYGAVSNDNGFVCTQMSFAMLRPLESLSAEIAHVLGFTADDQAIARPTEWRSIT
jgi:hypothetical protein